jgi:hypothetical protein
LLAVAAAARELVAAASDMVHVRDLDLLWNVCGGACEYCGVVVAKNNNMSFASHAENCG